MQAEKARQAVSHFIKAANITPNPALFENIAQCYLKIGEVSDFDTAVPNRPRRLTKPLTPSRVQSI
jgi:hypothetical protein